MMPLSLTLILVQNIKYSSIRLMQKYNLKEIEEDISKIINKIISLLNN